MTIARLELTPPTLGADLERRRLHARAERVSLVLRSLEARHREYAAGGVPRAPLQAAIRDFHAELDTIRGRLAELHPRASTPAGDSRMTRHVG